MAESRLDARQTRSRDTLDQIAKVADKELDDLLRSINKELTPPLRMKVTETDRLVTIEALTLANPETGVNRVIPPISNLLPFGWTTGTVTVPATSGGSITNDTGGPSVTLTVPSNEYIRMGISVNSLGQLQITLGTPHATLASATAPAVPNNTFGIGHVVLFNNAGTIDDVLNSALFQYVGGGGGGAGNANTLETAIRDQLLLSPCRAATPNIFELDEEDLVDPTSTGTFSIVTGTYDLNNTEVLLTKQLLDANEFLDKEKDLHAVDLTVFWNSGNVDTGATYEVSRDGGVEWQVIDMARVGDGTSAYYGSHKFTEEATDSSLDSQLSTGLNEELNDTTASKIAQIFSNVASAVVKSIRLSVTVNGSPQGTLCVLIAKDNGGTPGEIIAKSAAVDITSLSTGVVEVEIGDTVMIGGDTYYLIIQSDQDYKDNFAASTTSLFFSKIAAGGGLFRQNDSGTWSAVGSEKLYFDARGRLLDLRVRITGSATTGKIAGYGAFYDKRVGSTLQGIPNFDRKDFKAVADNDDTFSINFVPDPRLLEVYYVQTGQVFKYPAFSIQGQDIVFDADTFNNGGIEADVTLLFLQAKGSSHDNSDRNAALMSENHLGSEDPAFDFSQNGRGIKIRNAAGDLREIGLDEDDNITVSSLP